MKREMHILYLLLLMLFFQTAFGQQVVHKVSKTENTAHTDPIGKLVINGEKATINIEGWHGKHIEIETHLISRNSDKKTAINDLAFIKTEAKNVAGVLVIRNFFEGRLERISSNLSVEFHIKVPHSIEIDASNLYGLISIKNINNAARLDAAFGTVEIANCTGRLSVMAKYSMVKGEKIDGAFAATLEKSDITLKEVNAPISIESKYGEINIELSGINPLTINSQRAQVTVLLPAAHFHFNLNASYSEILFFDKPAIKSSLTMKSDNKESPSINISTSYCPIQIKKKKD